MKAMILAAGFGTRFRPITYTLPKPMLPLCNRPLIAYALDALVANGIHEIIVNLHHRPDAIERFISNHYGDRCRVSFSNEEEILGTGGGIRRVRPFFEGESSFFVMNGDTIQWPPVAKTADAVSASGSLAALVLRHPPAGDRFTPVYFDGERVTGIGSGEGEPLMFSGSHTLSSRVFDRLPDREFSGITEDVYIPALRSGADAISGVVDDGLWFDIGTPERYFDAAEALLSETLDGKIELAAGSEADWATRVIRDRSARIDGDCRDSVVGAGSSVAKTSVVSSSALWDGVAIGEACKVQGSVIASGVTLPSGAEVTDAIVCRRSGVPQLPDNATVAGELIAVPVRAGTAAILIL